MEEKYCQSCGMPMSTPDAAYGTNADGTLSEDYCSYCYEKGAFHGEETLEEMIECCVPHMVGEHMTEDQARQIMKEVLPKLKRWQAQ